MNFKTFTQLTMRNLLYVLIVLTICSCQNKTDQETLIEISDSLQNLEKIQYRFHFEQKGYKSENSNYSYTGLQAIDFTKNNRIGADVYSKRTKNGEKVFERLAVGDTLIKIIDETKTIVKSPNAQAPIIYGNVVLYFNIFDLRKSLPLVLIDSTMTALQVSDTTIHKVPAINVTFKLKKHILGGKLYDTNGMEKTYQLIVRKQDYAPLIWAFSSPEGNMSFSYSDIQLDIDNTLWSYNPQKKYTVISDKEYRLREKNKLNRTLGSTLPDWELSSIRGKKYSNKSFQNQLTLYEFFFVGCAGSIASKPFINELAKKYGEKLNIVNIEIQNNSREDVTSFVEKYHLKEPVIFNAKDLANQLGVVGCPTYILVNTSGEIIFSSYGEKTGLTNLIEKEIEI